MSLNSRKKTLKRSFLDSNQPKSGICRYHFLNSKLDLILLNKIKHVRKSFLLRFFCLVTSIRKVLIAGRVCDKLERSFVGYDLIKY